MVITIFMVTTIACLDFFGISFHQYADDTQLYISAVSGRLQLTLDNLDRCSSAVQTWFTHNGLCLNPLKSEVLFLGTRQQLKGEAGNLTAVNITGCQIKLAENIKSLGVILDNELSLDDHIQKICQSAQFHIRALRHIRQSLTSETACSVACSIVGSRLDYCNSILHGISGKNLDKLQRIQNTLARVVAGKRKFDHITPVLKKLHWLPIRQRIIYKIASIVFKVKQTHEPAYLACHLVDSVPTRLLRHNPQNILVKPRARTILASRAFSIAAPSIWNDLPQDIRVLNNLGSFKNN